MKTKDGLLKTEDILLKTEDILLKTKDSLLKTDDGLLKTDDVVLKTKDSPSVNRKLLTHILTNIPTYQPPRHTHRHLTWMITISSAYS